jgi:hypothetical protein
VWTSTSPGRFAVGIVLCAMVRRKPEKKGGSKEPVSLRKKPIILAHDSLSSGILVFIFWRVSLVEQTVLKNNNIVFVQRKDGLAPVRSVRVHSRFAIILNKS